MAPILAYWSFRGIGEPIRYMLIYAGQEFEDKQYVYKHDKSCWLDVKFTLGLDFPNLPYYINGDVKLTQSTAILRYLADIHDLNPKTQEEKIRVYVSQDEIIDFRMEYIRMMYNTNAVTYDQVRAEFFTAFPTKLKTFSDYLGSRKWLAGETLTYVDFMFYEHLAQLRALQSDCLQPFVNLSDYTKRFEVLPRIGDYMKTDKFKNVPVAGVSR